MTLKKIAIITARGGSKRIPRKNIRDFNGKPIIAYSIEAALESNIFDEVMVSTDDEEIKDIAIKYGANVPFFRSKETSNDTATTAEVLIEVINEYKKRGKEYKYMCCIYPTAPFVTSQKIQEAFEIIERENVVQVLPVVSFSYPPQRCFIIDEEKNMSYKYPEYITARSQDLEKHYHDAGQFYVLDVEKYIKLDGKVYDNMKPVIVSETEVQDIDNEDDWTLAEIKYKFMIDKIQR